MAEKQGDLPIREDMTFQNRNWMAERIGWTLLAIVVVMALLGVFGRGPFSDGRTAGTGTATVTYERFAHKTARAYFTIHVAQTAAPETTVHLSSEFARTYDVEVVQPQPLRAAAEATGLAWTFASSSGGPLTVHIAARPRRFGDASLAIEIEGQGRVTFKQRIYP